MCSEACILTSWLLLGNQDFKGPLDQYLCGELWELECVQRLAYSLVGCCLATKILKAH